MALGNNILPIKVGETSTDEALQGRLGELFGAFDSNGNEQIFRLVKNGTTAITAAAGKVLCTGYSSGRPTHVTVTTTTAADEDVAGVVPSDVSVTIAASAYYLLQVSGYHSGIVVNVTTALKGDPLHTSTAAGRATEPLNTTAVVTHAILNDRMNGVFAMVTASAGVTAAGLKVAGVIRGLL